MIIKKNIIIIIAIIHTISYSYSANGVNYSNLSPKSTYIKNKPKQTSDNLDTVKQTTEAIQIEKPDFFKGPADPFLGRIASERMLLLQIHQKWDPSLDFFGSARIKEDHEMFAIAEELGKYALWLLQRPIRTGAGPSMMDAPCRGYSKFRLEENIAISRAIMTQGIRIFLPFEQGTNPFINDNYEFTHFTTRVEALISNIFGLVALPGGFGTINEIFQVWVRDFPIILFDYDQYWTPIYQALQKSFKEANLILPDSKVKLTDDKQETIRFFLKAKGNAKPTLESVKASIYDLTTNYLKLSYLPPSITIMGEPQLNEHNEKLSQMVSKLVNNDYYIRIANNAIYKKAHNIVNQLDKTDYFQSTLYQAEPTITSISKPKELITNNMFNYNILTTKNSQGHIFFPGGVEVLNSLFDLMTIIQTGKVPKRPIVLIGKQFWEPIISTCIKQASEKFAPPLISPEKDSDIVKITDSVEEALIYLRNNAHSFDRSSFKKGYRITEIAA